MKNITTLGILLLLTILVSLASTRLQPGGIMPFAIMGIAMTKLLLVAFQFMELRKAHLFWKVAVSLFAVLILTAASVLAGR